MDPLHLIENHSKLLFNFIQFCLTARQRQLMGKIMTEKLHLNLKEGYCVANWRLIWVNFRELWNEVLDSEKVDDQSGSQINQHVLVKNETPTKRK